MRFWTQSEKFLSESRKGKALPENVRKNRDEGTLLRGERGHYKRVPEDPG